MGDCAGPADPLIDCFFSALADGVRVAAILIKFIRNRGCAITGHDRLRHPRRVRGGPGQRWGRRSRVFQGGRNAYASITVANRHRLRGCARIRAGCKDTCRQLRCRARFRHAPDRGSRGPGRCQRQRGNGWAARRDEEAKNPLHLSSRGSEAHVGAPAANEKAAENRGLLFFLLRRYDGRCILQVVGRTVSLASMRPSVPKPIPVRSTSYFTPAVPVFLNVETYSGCNSW